MAADCCGSDVKFDGLSADYMRRLWLVIAINAAMFLVEMGAGALAGSQALKADALDFLGDSATYGISLAVVGASVHARSWAAIGKAASLSAMALWVLGTTAYHVLIAGVPHAEVMGTIGVLALLANVGSVLILMRYKDGDAMCGPSGFARAMMPSATWRSWRRRWLSGSRRRDGRTLPSRR